MVQHRDIKVVKGDLEELSRTQTAEKWQKISPHGRKTIFDKLVQTAQAARLQSDVGSHPGIKRMFGRWQPKSTRSDGGIRMTKDEEIYTLKQMIGQLAFCLAAPCQGSPSAVSFLVEKAQKVY